MREEEEDKSNVCSGESACRKDEKRRERMRTNV